MKKEISEEIVDSLNIEEQEKSTLKDLLYQRGQLNSQIKHAESMAEALSPGENPLKEIKCTSEQAAAKIPWGHNMTA